jgi:hypothetical protein
MAAASPAAAIHLVLGCMVAPPWSPGVAPQHEGGRLSGA